MRQVRRASPWIIGIALALAPLFAFPTSRFTVLGLVRGEAFHDDRSMSHWAYLLRNADEVEMRKLAAVNLGRLGERAHGAEPALSEALRDPADVVRLNTALALFKIGPEAPETIVALAAALHDPHPQVRLNSAIALARVGPAAQPALPDLIAEMERKENAEIVTHSLTVRLQVIRALGRIGPEAHAAVPALIVALDDKFDSSRLAAVVALGRIGPAAAAALPKLKLCWENPDAELSAVSAAAIADIDKAPEAH